MSHFIQLLPHWYPQVCLLEGCHYDHQQVWNETILHTHEIYLRILGWDRKKDSISVLTVCLNEPIPRERIFKYETSQFPDLVKALDKAERLMTSKIKKNPTTAVTLSDVDPDDTIVSQIALLYEDAINLREISKGL